MVLHLHSLASLVPAQRIKPPVRASARRGFTLCTLWCCSAWALIIKEGWCQLILSGNKTWEIWGEGTPKRERIAIAQAGSGLLLGDVDLVDCIFVGNPDRQSQYLWAAEDTDKPCIPDESAASYTTLNAWEKLSVARSLVFFGIAFYKWVGKHLLALACIVVG